jgi:DNA (cytosine-5)-methyltransferase 1
MVNQQSLNELALFAGAGGGILGGHLLGWRTACAVEWNAYAASVLLSRQNDGMLPPFPIWDDVQTFDGRPWRGIIDVISGGFPCQDISSAGKGKGITGEKSGMWRHMARIICEVRPRYAFIENSPMLITRGLDAVLGDLAALGYDAEWGIISAADCGANHQRERIWVLGHDNSYSKPDGAINDEAQGFPNVDDTDSAQCEGVQRPIRIETEHPYASRSSWWEIEPDVGRVVDGLAARVERLTAIGNGQVPGVAARAFNILRNRLVTA